MLLEGQFLVHVMFLVWGLTVSMHITVSCGVTSALSGEATDHRKDILTLRLVSSPTEVNRSIPRKSTYLSALLDQDLTFMTPIPPWLLITLAAQRQIRCICVFFLEKKGKLRKNMIIFDI